MWVLSQGAAPCAISACYKSWVHQTGHPEVMWAGGGWDEWLQCLVKGSAKAPQSSISPESSGRHNLMAWKSSADVLPG